MSGSSVALDNDEKCENRTWQQDRDVPIGGLGALHSPIFTNLQESWSKDRHPAIALLGTVFSVTSFLVTIVGQLVKTPPPNRRCLSTSLQKGVLLSPITIFSNV